jgi:hypothetical protein
MSHNQPSENHMMLNHMLLKKVTPSLRLLLIVCSLLLLGCATSNKISQDFKPNTNFSHIKTFAWHNFSSAITTTNNAAIKNIIEQTLIQQGFQLASESADFILDMNIIAQQRQTSSPRFGISLGLPIGNSGAIGLGTSKSLGDNNAQEGLIILDITEQSTHQIMWRGSAEAIPIEHFLLRNERYLNVTLKKLIAQFPPK